LTAARRSPHRARRGRDRLRRAGRASITLPERTDEDRIRARYDRGVLEVVVNLKDQAAVRADKRIPVRTKAHIKPT